LNSWNPSLGSAGLNAHRLLHFAEQAETSAAAGSSCDVDSDMVVVRLLASSLTLCSRSAMNVRNANWNDFPINAEQTKNVQHVAVNNRCVLISVIMIWSNEFSSNASTATSFHLWWQSEPLLLQEWPKVFHKIQTPEKQRTSIQPERHFSGRGHIPELRKPQSYSTKIRLLPYTLDRPLLSVWRVLTQYLTANQAAVDHSFTHESDPAITDTPVSQWSLDHHISPSYYRSNGSGRIRTCCVDAHPSPHVTKCFRVQPPIYSNVEPVSCPPAKARLSPKNKCGWRVNGLDLLPPAILFTAAIPSQ
jgi:hypothetical protein